MRIVTKDPAESPLLQFLSGHKCYREQFDAIILYRFVLKPQTTFFECSSWRSTSSSIGPTNPPVLQEEL